MHGGSFLQNGNQRPPGGGYAYRLDQPHLAAGFNDCLDRSHLGAEFSSASRNSQGPISTKTRRLASQMPGFGHGGLGEGRWDCMTTD